MRFAVELRRLRLEASLSQQDLARLIHYDRSLISLIENGHATPSRLFASRCDLALRAEGKLVRLASDGERPPVNDLSVQGEGWSRDDTAALAAMLLDGIASLDPEAARRLSHEWLVSDPPQVIEMRSGRRVGAGMVATVKKRAAALRRLDDQLGGADLLDVVVAELTATVNLVREASYTERIGAALLSAVGDLAQIAGWVAADAGQHDAAARYYIGGAHAAHAAGDRALAAQILSLLSYLTAAQGDPRDAVLLARTAYRGGQDAMPGARVLMGERVAWAHATAGERSKCDRVLDEVEEQFALVDPAAEPDWAYWLDRDEVDIMAGRCHTELQRPMKAVPLLTTALERYGQESPRESALYTTWLADSYIHAGEVDQAAEAAGHALDLSVTVNSPRSRDRVTAVRMRLKPFRTARSVREFEERYRAAARDA